jgi:dTDP-4-amino-4,6-dideoxygalactose transaminase
MKIPFVDLHAQYLGIQGEIDAAIAEVIRESGFVRSRFVDEFERLWAGTIGTKHCVSCANGTDALFIAMRGLGIKPGDEVITTSHSWIATSETITLAGGRVVFCDTQPGSFNIDPMQIASKITPRTVGVIPVHLCGQAADMEAIMSVAKQHGLWVIEDCAQSHLATYQGRIVGTFGNAATFSFYPGKNLGAMGDAGCLVTNDDSLAGWCTLFARHGGKSDHVMEGVNSRLDGLQAAILSAKLPHLRSWTETRRHIAARYDSLLAGVGGIATPKVGVQREHVYHLYMIRTPKRDELRRHLSDRGIATVINYPKALPFYPAYAYLGHRPEDFPNAHEDQSRILSLPIFPEMSADQIEYVASSVASYFERA